MNKINTIKVFKNRKYLKIISYNQLFQNSSFNFKVISYISNSPSTNFSTPCSSKNRFWPNCQLLIQPN